MLLIEVQDSLHTEKGGPVIRAIYSFKPKLQSRLTLKGSRLPSGMVIECPELQVIMVHIMRQHAWGYMQ